MRVTLRQIWPSTYVIGAILLLSVVLPLPSNGKILNVGSICAFHNVFGLPCPGCGLTRSFVSMGHGLFMESYRWHPLGPVLFVMAIIYFLASLLFIKKLPPLKIDSRLQVGALLSLALVMFVFWGLRLDGIFPLPAR